MIYEIRDYTIEEQWFEKYVFWAKNYFMPYAKEKIDIIDFWVYVGLDAEVEGQNPIVSPNGQPNITWVAKYENKLERDKFFESLETDPEWDKVWSKVYIQENLHFLSQLNECKKYFSYSFN